MYANTNKITLARVVADQALYCAVSHDCDLSPASAVNYSTPRGKGHNKAIADDLFMDDGLLGFAADDFAENEN